MNKVILCGNLGQDPELKFTQGGEAVLKMRIATSERWTDKSGEKKESTEWHTVVLWGKRAEALSKILAKGRTVVVEGKIQSRSWDDKDGQKRYATDIKANDIQLVGGGGGSRDSGQGSASSPGKATDAFGGDAFPADYDDPTAIPF